MRQKTKKHRNLRSVDNKFRFFSQSRRHMARWVRLVQKTRAKNSHAWAPLRLRCKKKVSDFPVLSRDDPNQTLPGREKCYYSRPGRVWLGLVTSLNYG